MICFSGNLPVLQIGNHQVVGYGTEWIEESLKRAAASSNRLDFPFIEDIRDGIVHYLEHRCSLRLLPIEDLYEKMRCMLNCLGCTAIAHNLTVLSPPITISLAQSAREAGTGFELAFFLKLGQDIEELIAKGVESIRFCDIEECSRILRGHRTMTKSCRQLAEEIIHFVTSFPVTQLKPESD